MLAKYPPMADEIFAECSWKTEIGERISIMAKQLLGKEVVAALNERIIAKLQKH